MVYEERGKEEREGGREGRRKGGMEENKWKKGKKEVRKRGKEENKVERLRVDREQEREVRREGGRTKTFQASVPRIETKTNGNTSYFFCDSNPE